MRRLVAFRILALSVCALPCAFGYIGETLTTTGSSPQTVQITRTDFAGIQFNVNSTIAAGAQSSVSGITVITASSNPVAAVEGAMAQWNNVGSSSIHFNALQTSTLTTTAQDPTAPSDICSNLIGIGSTKDDLSVLGFVSNTPGNLGVIAVTANAYVQGAGAVCGGSINVTAGSIFGSDILLNPYVAFSTDGTANTQDLQAVMTHEFGHSLGMNHSGLVGATMYPYAALHERHLTWDEKAFAAAYYPSGKTTLGTINGTVTLGTAPVTYGLVTLTELSGTGRVVGTLTAADGTYSVQVPPGTYNVYTEPFNSFIGATNIYSLSTGTLNPTQATTAFMPTFSGGNIPNPATFVVSAGSTSTANISVLAGATPLTVSAYGLGAVGANGDVSSFLSGAAALTAGQSYDFAFAGPGIDATVSVKYVGTNVTVGSPRADTKETITIGGVSYPLIRVTLAVGTPQTNATLGSLWIVKGTSYLSLSGILDLEPMVPTINNVEDAESARTSFTSGQWAAIYGNNLTNSSSQTWSASADFTGGVTPGSPLPTSLGGVSVTVNGVPAGVYFVCAICSPNQINFVTPSALTPGSASVVVSNLNTASAPFTTTVVQASPSFFYYAAGGNIYPLAVHLSDGVIVGDPAVLAGTEKAHPGETLEVFANGIAPATGGIIVPVTAFTQTVGITAGSTSLTTSAPYLVAAGEFQINVTLPQTIATGTYQLTMTVPGGSTSTSGVNIILPVGP